MMDTSQDSAYDRESRKISAPAALQTPTHRNNFIQFNQYLLIEQKLLLSSAKENLIYTTEIKLRFLHLLAFVIRCDKYLFFFDHCYESLLKRLSQ